MRLDLQWVQQHKCMVLLIGIKLVQAIKDVELEDNGSQLLNVYQRLERYYRLLLSLRASIYRVHGFLIMYLMIGWLQLVLMVGQVMRSG